MQLAQSSSVDGFGGRTSTSDHDVPAPAAGDDRPYGARSLGAATDAASLIGGPAISAPAPGPITWNVQRLLDAFSPQPDAPERVQAAAAHGTSGAATALPHHDAIQRSFGRHDVGGIAAHVGGPAREGAAAMGAEAYATGNQVAFAGAPSLHTAAHEAAHVVQQRAGVHLQGGVGAAGDVHERHADAVADRVVAGDSAEDLLDEHAPAGDAPAAAATGPVQKLIATTAHQLGQQFPIGDVARAAVVTVGQEIGTYNQIAQNNGLAAHVRLQNRVDQLRVLDRAVHVAFGLLSGSQVDLRHDPRAQLLHTVLQQSELEHRDVVDAVAGDPNLRNQVDCFNAAGTTNQHGDIGQAEARQLWGRIMDGGGKIQILGSPVYQSQVRSWLTRLMDTRQGRRMLKYLDDGNQGDLGTNVYIGELVNQLPPGVRMVANASGDLADKNEAVAQPLLGVDTKTTLAPQGVVNAQPVANGGDYNDAVLSGAPGVSMGGNDYGFGASSGSYIAMTNPGAFRVAGGVDRQNLHGNQESPELYQPDWLLLGHELGHSVNMRAGATTDGVRLQDNPTDVFSQQMTGNNNRNDRQGRWFGGSEEYINITGHENRLRAEAGLDPRGSHTAPVAFENARRKPAFDQALNPGAWAGMYQGGSPTEQQRLIQYNADRLNLETRFQDHPTDPQHLVDAANLCQQMVAYFQLRQQQRNASTVLLNAGDGARNALDPNRPYELTLRNQYDHVKQAAAAELIEHVGGGPTGALNMQRITLFCQLWLVVRQAHDQAGLRKQAMYKAWWDKAKSANHSVGTAIVAGDLAKYQRKFQRLVSLRQDYN